MHPRDHMSIVVEYCLAPKSSSGALNKLKSTSNTKKQQGEETCLYDASMLSDYNHHNQAPQKIPAQIAQKYFESKDITKQLQKQCKNKTGLWKQENTKRIPNTKLK